MARHRASLKLGTQRSLRPLRHLRINQFNLLVRRSTMADETSSFNAGAEPMANSKSTSKNRLAGNLIPRQPHQPLPRISGAAGNDVKVDRDQRIAGSSASPAGVALSLAHGSSTDAGVSPVDGQANGDESDARMAKIEEILGHAAMHLLEKCALVAEWVRYAEAKLSVSGHFVQKPGGGRPEGGVARAARELPIPGKSIGARRKFIERALKISGIWPEAKVAARAAGLDDNQSALLAIASEHSQAAQLAKVQEIATRKAMPRRKSGPPEEREGAQKTEESDRTDKGAMSISEEGQLAQLKECWLEKGALQRDEWKQAPETVRHRFFTDVLAKDNLS
jgi:hypothetical protein